jgi:endonuclease-3 related protein
LDTIKRVIRRSYYYPFEVTSLDENQKRITAPDDLYRRLQRRYGDMDWWPGDGPFEVMVGAVLTQRTAWRNVERALQRLSEAGVRDPASLLALSLGELEELIRPSGTYRQKARRLRRLFETVTEGPSGTLEAFLDRDVDEVRGDLLAINGIGPETADSIVLYAAALPVFVIDAYTVRILGRLGIDPGSKYDEVATWFTNGLPEDAALYNNFHAVLVAVAKDHCRKVPICQGCPLGSACPSSVSV